MQSSDIPKLSAEMARIRLEITSRQATEHSQGKSQGSIYLGDLGHHCEALLEEKVRGWSTFSPTHSDEQSWIDYLEDGFEIPY